MDRYLNYDKITFGNFLVFLFDNANNLHSFCQIKKILSTGFHKISIIYHKKTALFRCRLFYLIFVFVEKEIVFGGVIRPNLFNAFIRLAIIFELL